MLPTLPCRLQQPQLIIATSRALAWSVIGAATDHSSVSKDLNPSRKDPLCHLPLPDVRTNLFSLCLLLLRHNQISHAISHLPAFPLPLPFPTPAIPHTPTPPALAAPFSAAIFAPPVSFHHLLSPHYHRHLQRPRRLFHPSSAPHQWKKKQ